MHIEKIRELILSTRPDPNKKGRLFEVTFFKKSGEKRVLRGRLGVTKGVTGAGQNYDPSTYNLITVWEGANDFRNVPLDRITSLRIPDGSKHLKEVLS